MANSSDGVTIQLSEQAAMELYNWLESDTSPNYWETKGLGELQSALSTWHRYDSPISPGISRPVYDREVLISTLVYHYRKDISGCGCGWADLGASHPGHVADVYEESVRTLND